MQNQSPEIHSGWEIEAPTPSEPEYAFKVRQGPNKRWKDAFLTYNVLDGSNPSRSVLLISERSIDIPPSLNQDWNGFLEHFPTTRRFAAAKARATELQLNPAHRPPHEGVAVHKYGPVPCFLVGARRDRDWKGNNLQFAGQPITVEIAIFPTVVEEGYREPRPANPQAEKSDAILLLKAVQPCLEQVLNRYLEDACEDLHDIQNHLSLSEGLGRIQKMEANLRSSLDPKLRLLPTSSESHPPAAHDNDSNEAVMLANDIYQSKSHEIEIARMARHCITLISDHYHGVLDFRAGDGATNQSVQRARDSLSRWVQNPAFPAMEDGVDLRSLAKVASSLLNLTSPPSLEGNTPVWIGRLHAFASLLHQLRTRNPEASGPKVFISTLRNDQFSDWVFQSLKEAAKQIQGAPELIFVRDTETGADFHDRIRIGVWRSDGVVAVLGPSKGPTGQPLSGSYKYIVLEADLAVLWEKQMRFIHETSLPVEDVVGAVTLIQTNELLPTGKASKGLDRRKEVIKETLQRKIHLPVRLENLTEDLDSARRRITEFLKEFVDQLERARLVRGIVFAIRANLGPDDWKAAAIVVRESIRLRSLTRRQIVASLSEELPIAFAVNSGEEVKRTKAAWESARKDVKRLLSLRRGGIPVPAKQLSRALSILARSEQVHVKASKARERHVQKRAGDLVSKLSRATFVARNQPVPLLLRAGIRNRPYGSGIYSVFSLMGWNSSESSRVATEISGEVTLLLERLVRG